MNSSQFRGWLVIILIVVAATAFTTTNYTPKHSIYNTGELGASHLRQEIHKQNSSLEISRLLISPFGLNQHKNINFMIIIGSEREYTTAEINAYKTFVANGGSLIIFEDFGYAQSIAAKMGISYFDGVLRERNDQNYVNRPSQFFVKDYLSQYFGLQQTIPILVNEAAGIIDIQGLTTGSTIPVLATSPLAYIDKNNDNVVDKNDFQSAAGIPVGLFKTYEKGYLMVISDASIPLNINYHRSVDIQGGTFQLLNIVWSSIMITTFTNFVNATSIVFDESHQNIVLSSSSGLLNLLASTWVGIFNSANLIIGIFVAIIISTLLLNRDVYSSVIRKFRKIRATNITSNEFISNPTLAERSLSEQYILYKRMGTEFIHIANIELYNRIKAINRSSKFLEEFKQRYGNIQEPRSASELLEMHTTMRQHIANELIKWL